MAANLLVRRSTAGLLRLVRYQAATIATWRPSRSDMRQLSHVDVTKTYFGLQQYCRKYNLVKDTRSIDEILDSHKGFRKFRHLARATASAMIWSCRRSMMGFREEMIQILFLEHLMKHCSHGKKHMDEVLKFKEAFSLPCTGSLVIKAKDYCIRTLDYKEPPRLIIKHWLELNEENKIEARKRFECHLTPAVAREIEEDIMKIYQEITAKCDSDGRSTEM